MQPKSHYQSAGSDPCPLLRHSAPMTYELMTLSDHSKQRIASLDGTKNRLILTSHKSSVKPKGIHIPSLSGTSCSDLRTHRTGEEQIILDPSFICKTVLHNNQYISSQFSLLFRSRLQRQTACYQVILFTMNQCESKLIWPWPSAMNDPFSSFLTLPQNSPLVVQQIPAGGNHSIQSADLPMRIKVL